MVVRVLNIVPAGWDTTSYN